MNKIRKVFMLFMFCVLASSISIMVNASNDNHIDNYVSDNLLWKWYGGTWTTGALPKIDVDENLVEGVDYERSWAITRNIVNDTSDLEYLSYEEASNIEQLPGSVCEKITGLKDYVSEKVVCHVVYGYTYIQPYNLTKYKGENDPEYSYKVFNYNNLADDIGQYFDITIEREEGEEVGEYTLTPKFKLKDESLVTLFFTNSEERGSIQYIFKNLGRIIVEPLKGKLTIVEKPNEEVEEVFNETENLVAPFTDICLSSCN